MEKDIVLLLQVPDLDLNSAAHYKSEADKGLLAPIASLLEGQYSQQALQVGNGEPAAVLSCICRVNAAR